MFDPEAIARTEEVIDGLLLLAALGALDRSDAWAQLLMEIDGEAIVGIPTLIEAKSGVSLAYGYGDDNPRGDDMLGVIGEVRALCQVVTDEAVKGPGSATGHRFRIGRHSGSTVQLPLTPTNPRSGGVRGAALTMSPGRPCDLRNPKNRRPTWR